MKKVLFVFVFLIALVVAAYFIFTEGVLPVNRDDTSKKLIVIKKGSNVDDIANVLFLEKLIRNRVVFYAVVKQLGIERDLQAGDFELSPSMDAYTIAKTLTKGSIDVWVTIPEGLRKEEIAELLTKELPSFSSSEFLTIAREGYLFPDTYLLPRTSDADKVVETLLETHNQKVSKLITKDKLAKLGLESENDVLTLASLVEREARLSEDRIPVASVYLKRLSEPMRLQVDATVQYALGYDIIEKSWWKRGLTFQDLKVDSPYNTYENDGIPPGPICNPGLAAIEAVLEADRDTPYLYYVNDIYGKLHYAKNLAEHEKNVAKYVTGQQ